MAIYYRDLARDDSDLDQGVQDGGDMSRFWSYFEN